MTNAHPDQSSTSQARKLIRKRDFAGAVDVLQKLLETTPGDGDALELLGTVYFFMKDFAQARHL